MRAVKGFGCHFVWYVHRGRSVDWKLYQSEVTPAMVAFPRVPLSFIVVTLVLNVIGQQSTRRHSSCRQKVTGIYCSSAASNWIAHKHVNHYSTQLGQLEQKCAQNFHFIAGLARSILTVSTSFHYNGLPIAIMGQIISAYTRQRIWYRGTITSDHFENWSGCSTEAQALQTQFAVIHHWGGAEMWIWLCRIEVNYDLIFLVDIWEMSLSVYMNPIQRAYYLRDKISILGTPPCWKK